MIGALVTSIQTVYLKGCHMLVSGFAAGPWATNCWIAASAKGSECIVIDPGLDSIELLKTRLAENGLKPVAVLLTHGHIDHMWSVTPVADGYDIPAFIHASDRHLISDPLAGVGLQAQELVSQLGAEFVEPSRLEVFSQATTLEIAGLSIQIEPAPGHTQGSVIFRLNAAADSGPRMFSGDVLFKGSIGRTDLPGGNHETMLHSLSSVILPSNPETVVHCGHGPDTTIKSELAQNPYLQALMKESK
jgi:glyoxylase-like metal-dependent hydrolase (beta-lactamase superfamily II)